MSAQIPAWIAAVAAVGALVVAVLTYRIVRKTSASVNWDTRELGSPHGIRFALTNTGAKKARDVTFTFGPDQPVRILSAEPTDIDGGAFHEVHFISAWGQQVTTFTVTWREGFLPRARRWRTSLPGPPPKPRR